MKKVALIRKLCMLLVCILTIGAAAFAQNCTCPVNSLIINTGYDPVTATLAAEGINGAPGIPDPKWVVKSISPASLTAITGSGFTPVPIGNPANVIVPRFGWPTNAASRWISCQNSNFHGTVSDDYNMQLRRKFYLCTPSAVTCSLNMIGDQIIGGAEVDGVPYPITPLPGAFALTTFTTGVLPAGVHNLDILVPNSMGESTNPTGLNVVGTISTPGFSLENEANTVTPPPAAISGAAVLCIGDNSVYTCATPGGVWSCSPASVAAINPVTGMLTASAVGVATLSYVVPPCNNPSVFTVLVNPLPDIPTITETTGHHCEGQTLTFEVSGQPGMEISYWYLPLAPASTASTATLSSSGHFSETITATGPVTSMFIHSIRNLATGCIRIIDLTLPITVDPYVSVGDVTGPDPICEGYLSTYTSAVTGIGSGTDTWSVTSSPSFPVTVTPGAVPGTASVVPHGVGTITINHGASNLCSSAIGTPLVVNVMPTPDVPAALYIGCDDPCPGMPLTYQISGSPGSVVSWEWTGPSGAVHPGFPAVTLSSPSGIGTITIPTLPGVTGAYGVTLTSAVFPVPPFCSTTGMSVSIDVAWPTADFLQIPRPDICAGDCVDLFLSGPAGGTVYYTATPTGMPTGLAIPVAIGLGGTAILHLCPTTSTTYQIAGAATACPWGCTHMFSGSSFTLNVFTPPAIGLTSTPPVKCYGSPFTLMASCPTCTEPYFWEFPDPGMFPAYTPVGTPNYTMPWGSVSGSYSVTGTTVYPASNLSCSTTVATFISIEEEPKVNVTYKVTGCKVRITFTGTELCTVLFNALPFGSGPTYSVTTNAMGVGVITLTITTPTTYSISSITSTVTGCTNVTSSSIFSIIPSVPAPPTITGASVWDMDGLPGHEGCIAEYTSSVYPVALTLNPYLSAHSLPAPSPEVWFATGFSYTRILTGLIPFTVHGDDIHSDEWNDALPVTVYSSPTYSPVYPSSPVYPLPPVTPTPTVYLTAGVVRATEVTYMGCPFPIDVLVDVSCDGPWPYPRMSGGSDESGIEVQSLAVIPNPNAGTFTLSGSIKGLKEYEEVTIEIVDILGRTVSTYTSPTVNGKLIKTLVVNEDVANGTYLLRVKAEHANEVLRFTLQR